jgi:2-oxoglutarate dehydrogenase E2 component (dihydrolipoamide succinyltransferase)
VARVDVVMPQMGESIAEGTMSRWLKKVGDAVKRDEPIFEISTDKVDAEIPSPTSGVLAEVLVTEGQTVAVQTVVARIETDAAAFAAGASGGGTSPSAAQTPAAPAPAAAGAAASAPASAPAAPAPSAATTAAPAHAGGNGNSFEDRVRTKSSPLVRRIAAEHGIELGALQGSGIAGRVTKRDIMQYLEQAPAARPQVAAGVPATAMPAGLPGSVAVPAAAEHFGPLPQPWPGDTVEPMSKIRRITADHMTAAKRIAAHVTSFFEIDLTRVARIRQAMRREFEQQSGEKLTYLPFIVQAVTQTLKRHPIVNASVAGNEIIFRKQVNVGIAVALDWGLIVPVVKRADELSLVGLTRQINDLANRARSKKLQPAEVQDATFTITNPGVFGSLMGTPIIPVGTTAILGLGAIEKRPKVITGPDGEDTIAIRTCAYFSLSFDHRVVDGADADKYMADLKRTLESVPDAGF